MAGSRRESRRVLNESERVIKKKAPKEGSVHLASELFDGWMMGLEPTTLRTTI